MKAMDTSNESAVPSPEAPAPVGRRLDIAFAMPPWFDVPPRAYGGIESLAACLARSARKPAKFLFIRMSL